MEKDSALISDSFSVKFPAASGGELTPFPLVPPKRYERRDSKYENDIYIFFNFRRGALYTKSPQLLFKDAIGMCLITIAV